MSMETKTTSFISTAPAMTTKVPATGVITSSSSTQPTSGTTSTAALNNNNISAAATSIITAPLMSQQSQPVNNLQKQAANNVSVTIPGKPTVTVASNQPISGVGNTTITASSTAASGTPPTSTTVSSSASTGVKKSDSTATTTAISGGDKTNKSTTAPTGPTASATTVSSNNNSLIGGSVPQSPAKPTDLPKAKPNMMNGGSTIIMKQPPPPVTILPPTPAATPPPVHKQPPQFPQPQSTPPVSISSTNNTTPTATNQNSQSSANPSPPSPANNASVKQPPPTESPPTIQKIHNQEKPTQPLPPQHQVSSTSSPAHKQSSQAKDQQATPSGNQEQKVINNVTSSVTNPTSKIITTSNTTASSTTTVSSASTAIGGTPNNIINKDIVQSISRPAVVAATTAITTSQSTKSAVPSSIPAGKKMETSGMHLDGDKVPEIIADGKQQQQMKSDSQSSPFADVGGGDALGISSMKSTTTNGKTIGETEKKAAFILSDGVNSNMPDQNKNFRNDGSNKVEPSPKIETNVAKDKPISRPSTVANGGRKEEIGDDVKRIMEAIENAGLCGPKQPESSLEMGPDSNISSSSGELRKANRVVTAGSKINRPSTGRNATNKPQTRPGTTSTSANASSPTKLRPATASTVSKKDHENGINGSPRTGAVKSPRGKTAPASGPPQGSPAATLPPKSATSTLRTSTSRVASARGNTAPTSAKTPNENKNTTAKINGADSCNASPTETETRATSATGSRSTPRLRPSSSLYRPTQSSALKGVSSASPNSSSNHNLHSSPSTPRPSRSSTGPRPIRSTITMGDSAGGSGEGKPVTLRDQFTAFSRFGNKDEDGKHITLSNCDKWMKQAKVIDGKKVTTTDTSICFKKLFKAAKKITFEDFKKYVEELAKSKKIEPQELLDKLTNSGTPGLSSATRAAHSNVVDRLTDTSKYTGSHKERFDSTGKGRGMEGRKDVPDGSGYVAAFKEKLDIKDGDVKKEESSSPTPPK